MTSKPKKAAGKGKKAAAADKAETERELPQHVEEVADEKKATDVAEAPKAPPPEVSEASEASEESTEHTEAQQNGKAGNKKPTEAQAEAMAEQLVAQARKPMKKNDSQSSLAGSVTVSADLKEAHSLLHPTPSFQTSMLSQYAFIINAEALC